MIYVDDIATYALAKHLCNFVTTCFELKFENQPGGVSSGWVYEKDETDLRQYQRR